MISELHDRAKRQPHCLTRWLVHAIEWALLGALTLAGCSTYNSATQRIAQHLTPYQVTIVQGNFVSREAAAKLRVGMSREEVRNVLGTPLLTDIFHADRWDYLFYFKRGSLEIVQRRDLVVYFDETGRVTQWSGADNLPSEQELIAKIDGDRKASTRAKQKALAAGKAAPASAANATTDHSRTP